MNVAGGFALAIFDSASDSPRPSQSAASGDRFGDSASQSSAPGQRAVVRRVRVWLACAQPLPSDRSETACLRSRSRSTHGRIRSTWSSASPRSTTGRSSAPATTRSRCWSAASWTDYQVSFTWMHDIEALHLACAFDLKVPERAPRRGAAADRADQRAAVGRPFRPVDQGRHGDVPPRAGAGRRRRGVEPAMRGAARAARSTPAKRYFPAFQFVVWAGKPAREALDAAMFETSGEA